jgi:3-hydroxymyristoyl/3-hydroxydecanoyl-(acyl carrier protein) dehydratase
MTDADQHPLLRRLPAPGNGFPHVLSIRDEAPATRLCLDIAGDLSWFQGHFPGQPVLPGIVQLHWAVLVCRALYDFDDAPQEIKRLKFKNVVVPPRALELLVVRKGEHEAQFRFSSDGEENSEGRIVFPGSD